MRLILPKSVFFGFFHDAIYIEEKLFVFLGLS